MIPGVYSILEQSILGLDPGDDFSVGTPFAEFLLNATADRVYLFEGVPYDLPTAGAVNRYLSNVGFITESGDTPASQLYAARLRAPYAFTRQIMIHETFEARSIPGAGVVVINNSDGGADDYLDLAWDGRPVTIKLGGADFDYAEFGTIFAGQAEAIKAKVSDGSITVTMLDLAGKLDKPIQETHYLGTGGFGGGEELRGIPVPLAYGKCLNVEPVLIDAANLWYHVHDGEMEAIDAVYDKGVALNFTASAPGAGEYTTSLLFGLLQLGGTPAGIVTADIQGSKTGGVYANNVGTIMRRIAVDQGGLTDPDDIDTGAFVVMEKRVPYEAGIFLRNGANILDVFDELCRAVIAFWGFGRDAKLSVKTIREPSPGIVAFGDSDILALEKLTLEPPAYRMRYGNKRNWRVMTENEIAAGVSAAKREFLLNEYSSEEAEDTAVQTNHLRARDADQIPGLLNVAADAQSVIDRLLALHGTERWLLKITVKTQPFTLDVGDHIQITSAKLGLSAGHNFMITRISEAAGTNKVDLTVWGAAPVQA